MKAKKPQIPTGVPRTSAESGRLTVRTDLCSGLDLESCRAVLNGLCLTLCCPTPEGEKCHQICPHAAVF